MYAAVWINPEPERAEGRVVVCKPLLARQNAAVAVLRSEVRDDARSTILSGEHKHLVAFLKNLEKVDGAWAELGDDELIDTINNLAVESDISVVEWEGTEVQSHVVVAVRKNPKPKLYPRYITPAGKKIWDSLFDDYKKVINRYKSDKKKMWAAAILLLQRVASQRNVKPFSKDPSYEKTRSMSQQEINKRANNGNFKALEESERTFDELKKAGLVNRLTKEKFYEVAKHSSRYYITTYRWAKLRKGVQPNAVLRELLATQGYKGRPGKYAHKSIDAVTDLLVEPEGKDVYFYLTTFLTHDQVILLFDLDEATSDSKILKLMGKAGRQWVKTGVLVDPR